jgi:hypothetical protein
VQKVKSDSFFLMVLNYHFFLSKPTTEHKINVHEFTKLSQVICFLGIAEKKKIKKKKIWVKVLGHALAAIGI